MRFSDWSSDLCSSDLCSPLGSALTGLEPAVGLVDHVGTAAATDHAVVPMTVLERLQRIADLHVETLPIALVCQKIEGRQLWGRTTKVKRSLLFHQICVPRRAHRSEERSVGKEWVSTGRSR